MTNTRANTTNGESDTIEVLATCDYSRGPVAHFVSADLVKPYKGRIVRSRPLPPPGEREP